MKITDILNESGTVKSTGDFSPENIMLHVDGYGEVSLANLRADVKRTLSDIAAKADTVDPKNIQFVLNNTGLQQKIQALIDANEQLDTPQMKRKATMAKRQFSTESIVAVAKHIEQAVPFCDSIFRHGSTAYYETVNLGRELHKQGIFEADWESAEMFESDMGRTVKLKGLGEVVLDTPFVEEDLDEAEYNGRDVELNKPKRGGSKKFYVYVKNPKTDRVKKVEFGAKDGGGNLSVKLKDPKARKAFADRHNCEQKNDKTKAGYWSCRLPRYAKSLGLSGGGQWW